MMIKIKKFPENPSHPERICWGCDKFCAASDMRCGNGSDRTPHPAELFGEDWFEWSAPKEVFTGGEEVSHGVAALNASR